ncbi:sulfatase family protein [Lignipirellula cremea]|uniref:Arylsulfatase n=1 Tax=Lignipirellula cremea TaxID=2528010 RepID=A0A518DNV3_9BACT|nr:arylsulfatase [Lignipirellula cremea]QDU93518.1 Arylsulfatase [Lignipirellula cremea]
MSTSCNSLLSRCLLTLLAISFLSAIVQAEPAGQPNIVMLFADDMGIGDVGCYNAASKTATPNLDRLAESGMRFTQAYAAAAVCVPSRYSLLTGRYPFRGSPLRWSTHPTIPEGTPTLGSVLQDQGYQTACIGKWHAGFDGGVGLGEKPLTGGPPDRGFDFFFGQHGSLDQPPYFYIQDRQATQPATGTTPDHQETGHSVIYQGKFWRAGKIAPDFRHEEALERYATEAIRYLQSQGKKQADPARRPFFLYLALTAPHGPWLPSKEFRGRSQAGPLGDFVMQVDDVVGRVLATLDKAGLRENTLVLFSSDNGPLWFPPDVEKYGHDSSGGFRGRKGDIWDGGIRMPLIARWPGHIRAGSVNPHLCGLVDVMATFAEAAGGKLPAEAGVDSHSLATTLWGDGSDPPPRQELLLQSLGAGDLAIREGDWKYIPWIGSGGFLTKPRRVQPQPGEPTAQLYNLASDPGEQTNLFAQHPEIADRLAKRLAAIRASQRTRP